MWLILQIFAFHRKYLMWIPYCHLFAFYAKAFMWPPLKFLHVIRTSNIHKWEAWCILFFQKGNNVCLQSNKQTNKQKYFSNFVLLLPKALFPGAVFSVKAIKVQMYNFLRLRDQNTKWRPSMQPLRLFRAH